MGRNPERDLRVREMQKQKILETAFSVFAEKGIGTVSMNEIAAACGISYATLYRQFSTKAALVMAINSRIWNVFLQDYQQRADVSKMNAAEEFGFYLDFFLDLYRNHRGFLRFNQYFNVYVQVEKLTPDQVRDFLDQINIIAGYFHKIYEKGQIDQTLRTDIPENEMFSATMHLMLAAVTRYSVGLIFQNHNETEKELYLLRELLFSHYRA